MVPNGALQTVIIYCAIFPVLLVHTALLTNYLPAAMQALAYYIDQLQYEPLSTTTVEPPFSLSSDELAFIITTTTPKPTTPLTTKTPTTIWWKPPNWWVTNTTTTTEKPTAAPTPSHRPAIYAPILNKQQNAEDLGRGYELFEEMNNQSKEDDPFALRLIHDIRTEADHDEFTNDVESLDNFLRLYDDNYGRASFDPDSAMDRWSSTSTAGKKRVPPTKPYVEFLLVYDLLKRDAKAANLSKFEGYSETMLRELHELSTVAAPKQLFTIFQRMIDRGDIVRSDVVTRIQGIMKDLANPKSQTSKTLQFIPPLQFIP